MQHMTEVSQGRTLQIWALCLAAAPIVLFSVIALLPAFGERHPSASAVYVSRAALGCGLLMAIASLYLSARHFHRVGFGVAPFVAALVALAFLVWAAPYAYGVLAAILLRSPSAA